MWHKKTIPINRGVHPPKPMMHIGYSHISTKCINSIISAKFTFFASSYFDHDAFMHHALHLMDASVKKRRRHHYHDYHHHFNRSSHAIFGGMYMRFHIIGFLIISVVGTVVII